MTHEIKHPQTNSNPHVVVIGAGFGGLSAVKHLARGPFRITIIDRSNHHLFQPLLYQVATATVSPGDIAQPIRRIFRRFQNVQVLMASAEKIDLEKHQVQLNEGFVTYDYLIVAAGATHAYFGHDEWEHVAPGLKSLEDAIEIRRMFLMAFEEAEKESDPKRRESLMRFVIVGAGPTGVELAGTMADVARHALSKQFRNINPGDAKVILLEGSPRVLPLYQPKLSESAKKQLEKKGVQVRTNALVTKVEKGAVYIGDEKIETESIFWAAGVAASPLGKSLGIPTDRSGRVKVNPDLTIEGHPEIYVIGDLAALIDAKGKQVPGVSPAAIQMGQYAAKSIRAKLKGKSIKPFVYWDKGSFATIGRSAAVGYVGKLKFTGFIAWMGWLLIHIYFLIGFRNRIFVLIQWAWTYLLFNMSARLITYYDWSSKVVRGSRLQRVADKTSASPPAHSATRKP
jgi:NADH:ubiquinone reductase (H+-translocating)